MRKTIVLVFLIAIVQFANAQKGDFKIGFRLAPATNIATVKDNDPRPSNEVYIADGNTTKESNLSGLGVSFYFDYFFAENLAFSSGLWFTQKNFHIRNTDGEYYYNGRYNAGNPYSGVSKYNSTYMQIPLLLKYQTTEIAKKLKVYVLVGPTIDLKVSEKLDGPDYAHYWNMSRNYTYYDDARGRNSQGKVVPLFNPLDITLFLSGGVTYEIMDKLDIFGGIMFNKGFMNLVNPNLKFAEPNQTKVNSDITWKAFLVGMEMGVAYNIK